MHILLMIRAGNQLKSFYWLIQEGNWQRSEFDGQWRLNINISRLWVLSPPWRNRERAYYIYLESSKVIVFLPIRFSEDELDLRKHSMQMKPLNLGLSILSRFASFPSSATFFFRSFLHRTSDFRLLYVNTHECIFYKKTNEDMKE